MKAELGEPFTLSAMGQLVLRVCERCPETLQPPGGFIVAQCSECGDAMPYRVPDELRDATWSCVCGDAQLELHLLHTGTPEQHAYALELKLLEVIIRRVPR